MKLYRKILCFLLIKSEIKIMKKYLYYGAAAVVMLGAANAVAQVTGNTSAVATVVAPLSITANPILNFGQVTRPTTDGASLCNYDLNPQISPLVSASPSSSECMAFGTSTIGNIYIEGQGSEEVNVKATIGVMPSGVSFTSLNYDCASCDPVGGGNIDGGNLTTSNALILSPSGSLSLNVHGGIEVTPDANLVVTELPFIVDVSYNSLT